MTRRYQVFHAYMPQVPEGTSSGELPGLIGDPEWCAVSRLTIDVPRTTGDRVARLAARGMLFDAGLDSHDSITFVREVSDEEGDPGVRLDC